MATFLGCHEHEGPEHDECLECADRAVTEAAIEWNAQWNASAPSRDTAALYRASKALSAAVDALLALRGGA